MVILNWNGSNKCLLSDIYNFISEYNYDSNFYLDDILMKASQKWKIERILYLALIPISYWFILSFLNTYSTVNSINLFISSISNKFLLLIFFVISIFHIRIQLSKVYEDYFQLNKMKLYSLITDCLIGITFFLFLPVLFF
mgnify:FL=1